jgi:hypothetical protein
MSKVYAKYYHKRVHSWNKAEQKIRITGFSFLRTFGNNFPAHSLRRQGQEASFLNCALLAGIFNHLPVKEERASLTRGGNKAGDMELTRDLLKIDPAKGTDQIEHGVSKEKAAKRLGLPWPSSSEPGGISNGNVKRRCLYGTCRPFRL